MFPAVTLGLAISLFTAACGAARGTRAEPAAFNSNAAQEVEAVYRSGIAAFNRHALEEFTMQFGDDIEMYTPTGWVRGRAAVAERFRGTFAQFGKVRMVIDSLTVRSVGPATATVAFQWRVFPMGEGPAFHGVGSGVYVQRGGRWQEVLEHETVTRVDPALQPRQPRLH